MAADRQRSDERPRLPSDVYRDLKAASSGDLERVAADYAAAGEALEAGETARAIALLRGCKGRAGRSTAIREALGIALYLSDDFNEAARELSTYRRLSGRVDQNHLLADCARASGRLDKAESLVDEMVQANVSADRVAEGLLVVAGGRADAGDHRAALAALHRVDLHPRSVEPYHVRLWYLAGDLHEQLGERTEAAGYFEAITDVEPEFLDAAERAAALASDTDDDRAQPAGDSAAKRLRQ